MACHGSLRWAVDISKWDPQPAEFDHLLGLLPEDERTHCRKFRFMDDRKRALVSRLLQRASAEAVLGVPFREAFIKKTRGNKPYVANSLDRSHAPNFNYSVSHEGDYVIIATEPLCVCGSDVAAPNQVRRARQEPLSEFFKSFTKQFTEAEWESIHALAPDEEAMQSQFRRLWSLKEAYVKATGEGLGFELGNAEFTITGNTATVRVHGKPQPRWAFHLHELGNGHWASVARGPLDAVVDAWGGFKGTFQRPSMSDAELKAALEVAEPPFTMLSVADLLPEECKASHTAARGSNLWYL